MALGTPVITTPAGGNIEILTDQANGLLVPFNEQALFEKALKELHSNREVVQSLVQAAQKKSLEFSDERMLGDLVRILAQA